MGNPQKEFFTRIQHKHDTEANWNKATNFIPLQGEIIVYDIDTVDRTIVIGDKTITIPACNYERFKIGDGKTKVNDLPFIAPPASEKEAGVTIVYPAASCTTFSSDSGTVTPLAVQKGAELFAITRPPKRSTSNPANPGAPGTCTTNNIVRWLNTAGDVQDSKITIEDVTNTKNTSKKAQVITIPAEGNKKMVYGYCTDQVDGTSFIGGVFDANATSYPYAQGLAIGGTTGNLLWKGNKVIDTGCIGDYNVSLGQGYATCSTAAATVAKTASLSNYALATGGIVTVKFTNAVPANATLNINSKGAKAIYYKGKAITAGVIEAGDTATFIYNGSQYHLIAIDGSQIPENLLTIDLTNSNSGTAVGINADTLDSKHASDFITKTNITNSDGSVELVNNADTFCMKKVDDFILKEDTLEATQVTLSNSQTVEEAFAHCWFEFVDEEGNPTDEPYIHWMINSETGKPVTTEMPNAEEGEF